MATVPPSPLPPPTPLPPRSGSNALAIVLLSLGLIILLSVIAVWGGVHFLAHSVKINVSDRGPDRKEVSIKTPFGGIEVNKNGGVSESSLELPLYPGATRAADEDSASVSLAFPGANGLRIVAGKFNTPDGLDKVSKFYQDRLAAQDGPFTERGRIDSNHGDDNLNSGETGNFWGLDEEGKTVFKIKRKGEERVVALKNEGDGTRVELVRIGKSTREGN